MNISGTTKFMESRQDKILSLFLYYQMIEMALFTKLAFPEALKEVQGFNLEKLNKKLNSKTLGSMKEWYLKKYPKDKYNLDSILTTVISERNTFMHGLWMFLSLVKNEERDSLGDKILDQFLKNSCSLLDTLNKIKELSTK